ncbi:MAG: type I methionyl aminopeptidase [Chlorobia bacterium]|nr:type I methionyl aminopeptidase [Fimbriimonadaceae bacterium]
MIHLKSKSEIELMRKSGVVVARTIRQCYEAIVPGKTTTRHLDDLAARLIAEAGGVPSFLNYRGYAANTCISVNDVVIHGMPNDIPIVEGDIVDIDIGVCLNGWHADSAWTFAVGTVSPEAQRLLNISKEALFQGIAQAKLGNRIGDIASTVQKYAEKHGYGVVKELVGHGIGRKLHEEPTNVPNYGKAGKGEVLREGMTICIEPMINQGTAKIVTMPDKWTIKTADGKLSAHFEHTIAITRDGPDLLTLE